MNKLTQRSIIIISLITILVIICLLLPYALLPYVNYKLNQIPGYRAHISDIEVHLYKGGYVIKDIKLEKISNGAPVPFFSAKTIELAVEWKPLLRGFLVGEIQLSYPKLNFVVDPKGKNEQLTINAAWQEAVKAIFPLNFNKIIINNGQINYRSFTSNPPFIIYINNIEGTVDNLRNVTDSQQTLTSTLQMHGTSIGNASVDLSVKFNPFKKEPTFDLTAAIEQMDLSQANDFLKHYTKLKVASGIFSVYIEAAVNNDKIIGYVKPLIKNLKIADEKNKTPLHAIYKTTVKAVAKILENSRTKMIGTKVQISGRINNPTASIWSLIINILRNAFIQALLPQIDHSIEFKDIIISQS